MARIRGLPLRARHAGAAGALLLSVVLPSGTLSAQLSPEGAGSKEFSYEHRYDELRELQLATSRVAPVTQLVLKRDAGQFTFGDGTFYLLNDLDGVLAEVKMVDWRE